MDDDAGDAATHDQPGDGRGDGTSGDEDMRYEVAGGVIAGLGFVLTPLVTALPAGYCALKLRVRNPAAYYGILAVVATTVVFWLVVLFAGELLQRLTEVLVGGSLLLVVLVVPVAVLLVLLAGLAYLLLR